MSHSRMKRLLGGKDRDERGAITVFVVIIFIALIAMAGLVIDGGSALASKRRAMNTAEQAARVGADALDPASLRSGQLSWRPVERSRLPRRTWTRSAPREPSGSTATPSR